MSESMRPQPDQAVLTWLNGQETTSLFISTISIAEIRFGIDILPSSQRRSALGERFEVLLTLAFDGRVSDFDKTAAHTYGQIMSARKLQGRPMTISDGQIAAIAKSRGMAVATRDRRGFEGVDIELINPWVD